MNGQPASARSDSSPARTSARASVRSRRAAGSAASRRPSVNGPGRHCLTGSPPACSWARDQAATVKGRDRCGSRDPVRQKGTPDGPQRIGPAQRAVGQEAEARRDLVVEDRPDGVVEPAPDGSIGTGAG